MTTLRRPVRPVVRSRIAPDIMKLWRIIREIHLSHLHEHWEPVGRRREYFNCQTALMSKLGIIDPGATFPDEAANPKPPDWLTGERLKDYHRAHELFLLLEQAA